MHLYASILNRRARLFERDGRGNFEFHHFIGTLLCSGRASLNKQKILKKTNDHILQVVVQFS